MLFVLQGDVLTMLNRTCKFEHSLGRSVLIL